MRDTILIALIVSFCVLGSAGLCTATDAGDMMDRGRSMMGEGEGMKADEMMEKSGMIRSDSGSADSGKALFHDPKAFAGSGEMSCSSCHPDGKGLENAGAEGKTEWTTPVAVMTSLEDAINVCILMANKGKAIDPKSDEMSDVIAYIRSLGKGASMGMEQKKDDVMDKMRKKTIGY